MSNSKSISSIKLFVLLMITLSCGIQHNLVAQTNNEGYKTQKVEGDLLIYQTNKDNLIEEFYFIQGVGNVLESASLKSIELIDGYDEIVLRDWGNKTYAFTVDPNKIKDKNFTSVIGIGQYGFSDGEFLTASDLKIGYLSDETGGNGCPIASCVHGGCGSQSCTNSGGKGCSVSCQSGYFSCCRGFLYGCKCYSNKCCDAKE